MHAHVSRRNIFLFSMQRVLTLLMFCCYDDARTHVSTPIHTTTNQAVIALTVAITGKRARANKGDGMNVRQREISRVLSAILAEDAFSNAFSPQALAYQWMIFEDTMWSDIDHKDDNKENVEDFTVPDMAVVQRYSLAVFYFATGGPDAWVENNWLKGAECGKLSKWKGLQCDSLDMVRALSFGTFVSVGVFSRTFVMYTSIIFSLMKLFVCNVIYTKLKRPMD
jgi:hypothetical protein